MGFGGKFCDFFFIGVMSLGVKGGIFFSKFFLGVIGVCCCLVRWCTCQFDERFSYFFSVVILKLFLPNCWFFGFWFHLEQEQQCSQFYFFVIFFCFTFFLHSKSSFRFKKRQITIMFLVNFFELNRPWIFFLTKGKKN